MRIGLIGGGAVAGYHVAAAEAAGPGCTITAVCDIDEAAARRAAAPAPGASVFTDHRAMLDSGLVDAVVVNTPHALHLPMVVDAAQRGLHVLVEKPMATSVADCDTMLAACGTAGVTLAVGHIQHFAPDKVAAHALVSSGELGDVVLVRDQRSTDYRPGTRPDWFFSPEVAGGGALLNIGGHCLDRTLWFGGGRATEVSASTAHRFGSAVETDGTISLRLDSGVGATIAVVSDPPVRSDRLTVVCERGVVEADPRAGAVVQVDGRLRSLYEPRRDDIQRAFTAQLADFVAAVGGADPAVPVAHARHVVEVVVEGYRSAAEGRARSLREGVTLGGSR